MAELANIRITTGDAVQEVAPYKISAEPSKDRAEVEFTVTRGKMSPRVGLSPNTRLPPGRPPVVALLIELGGIGPGTGRALVRRFGVCGAKSVCGDQPCGFSIPADATRVEEIVEAAIADLADGEYPVNAYVLTRDEGWA